MYPYSTQGGQTGFQPYTGAGQQTPYYQPQTPTIPTASGQSFGFPAGQGFGFPGQTPPQGMPGPQPGPGGQLPIEESYIENILRLNKGKLATVYATFENNTQWNAKIFKGIIEAAGRDHLILSDPQTGQRILLPMVYLDYVTFDEEIEYEYPFGGAPNLVKYPPR
ncbi:spore coat protein GerQ [Neobacillus sp. D3-1R]|uniref:spore coat protein GerQ n=1 Tax=Neobacillus sp. D3-1R TaxID=3445778 RepID=UPI003FA0608B